MLAATALPARSHSLAAQRTAVVRSARSAGTRQLCSTVHVTRGGDTTDHSLSLSLARSVSRKLINL